MAIGGVTISGMASGLPPDLVDKLVEAQKTNLKAYQRDKDFYTSQQTSFGELETKMLALETKAKELQDTSAWSPHTTSTSDSDRITITADSSAQSSMHSVVVGQLATYDMVSMTTGVTDKNDTMGAGADFTFTYNGTKYGTSGDTQTPGFDSASLENQTLYDLASKINGIDYGDQSGVSASVLFDGSQYRLILTAKDSGTYNNGGDRITLEGSTSFSMAAAGSFDVNSFEKTNGSPQDAILKIDGIDVTSTSNQVTTALTGVTLQLKSITSGTTVANGKVDATGTPVNVTIQDDKTALKTTLTGFVDAFNGIIDYVNLHKTDSLNGDSLSRSVISQMRGVLNTKTQSATGDLTPFSTLAEMGLRTDQKTGKISFNGTSLDAALTTDFNSVTRLFTSKHADSSETFNEGLAYRMADLIDTLTSSTGGAVTGKKDGIKARLDRLDKSITRENARLDKIRETLTRKFSNLEQMISRMNSASGSMMSSLDKLK
ncbi:MAG: flagellar filament capping protein FliD [Magnetococcus sp. YQC-5]